MSIIENLEKGMGEGYNEFRDCLQGMGEGIHLQGNIKSTEDFTSTDFDSKEEVKSVGEGMNKTEKTSDKKLTLCPMCEGKGYYEEIGKPEISNYKAEDEKKEQGKVKLPSILQHASTHPLEQLFKANDPKALCRFSDPTVPVTVLKPNTRFPPVHIPNAFSGRAYNSAGQIKSTINTRKENLSKMINLLPPPIRSEKNSEDAVRLSVIKLNRNDWETKKVGLEECLQLSRFNPELLEPHMSPIYRTMSTLLNNFRPQVTLFTCQAAREFFAQMRSTCRPEFDELVFSLLNRTADNNKCIRLYANDALDKMVSYIPTIHAIRPLVDKGPIHNNPLVRAATARLLSCIVALKTPNVILTNPGLRDACKRIIETAAMLLADNNLETRSAAKALMLKFKEEEEFESIYYAEVEEKLRKRIDRTFIELMYTEQDL